MQSRLTERDGRLVEHFGPVRLTFSLKLDADSIVWCIAGAHVFGLRLPVSWFHGVKAREGVHAGRYTFDVRVELAYVGVLIHYCGWLLIDEDERSIARSRNPIAARFPAAVPDRMLSSVSRRQEHTR
jgi:hypothetical protein